MLKKITWLALIISITSIVVCHAQIPFKDKIWYCFKTVDHGETAANKILGDSHGINPASSPQFLYYYDFRNDGQHPQHFVCYSGSGEREYDGTWNYNSPTLRLRGNDHLPVSYKVVLFSDPNFMILTDSLNKWYYFASN